MVPSTIFVFVVLETCFLSFSNAHEEINFDLPQIDPKFIMKAPYNYFSSMYKYTVIEENGKTRTKRDTSSVRSVIIDSKVESMFEILGKKGTRLTFVKPENIGQIMQAELKVFQEGNTPRIGCENITVTVYGIVDSKELELRYVSSLNTTGNYTGWLSFNVTSSRSLMKSYFKKGLLLTTHSAKIKDNVTGMPEICEAEVIRPFLIVYMKKVKQLQFRTNLTYFNKMDSEMKQHFLEHLKIKRNRTYEKCQVYRMFVDFRDLGWEKWIIAPSGYYANYCAGKCSLSLLAKVDASNHATVQTLMNIKKPKKIPKSRCVPSSLESITVLTFHNTTHVSLQKLKDMVVKSCRCA